MMIVRHGFMIVGDPLGGKTMAFKVNSNVCFKFCCLVNSLQQGNNRSLRVTVCIPFHINVETSVREGQSSKRAGRTDPIKALHLMELTIFYIVIFNYYQTQKIMNT